MRLQKDDIQKDSSAPETPGDEFAQQTDGTESEEGGWEEEEKSKLRIFADKAGAVAGRAGAFALRTVKKPKVLIGAAVVVGLAVLGNFGYKYYVNSLLDSAEEAIELRDNALAAEYVNLYESLDRRTPDSLRLLARLNMFSGGYARLSQLLASYEGDDPEVRYIKTIADYLSDEEATDLEMQVLSDLYGDELPYIPAAAGVLKLIQKDISDARPLLSEISDSEDIVVNLHLIALYDLFLENHDFTLKEEVPPPFAAPSDTVDRGLKFAVDAAGFENTYGIPLSRAAVGSDSGRPAEGAPRVAPLFNGLQLLANAQTADVAELHDIVRAVISLPDISLLTRYIAAFAFARAGQYGRAAEEYRAISEQNETTFSAQFEAAALWMRQNGAPPEDRVWERIRRAILLDGQNVEALNNAAFLEFNYGDADEAERLIAQALGVSGLDPHVVFNRILIRSAAGTLKYAEVHVDLPEIIAQYPDSETIYHLAAGVESALNNHQEAINLLSQLSDSENAGAALNIADRYRYLGQLFLAIRELREAQKRFPGNPDIAGALAVYHSLNNDKKEAEQAIAGLPPESDYALHAQAVLEYDRDYEQAAEIGIRALEAAPPQRRSAVALDMTRIYLNVGEVKRAREFFAVARENAEYSPLFGLENAIVALDYRIRAEEGAPIADEVTKALEKAAERRDIFGQIDLAVALIRLERNEEGIAALERLRNQQRVGNIKTIHLFAALIAGYEKLGQQDKLAQLRANIAAIEAGKDDSETNFAGARSASLGAFSGRSEALAEAGARIKQRDYEGAIEIFTALIEDKDSNLEKPALTFQNRGVLYIKLKRYEEAARDFAAALEMKEQLAPNEYAAVHYNYVNALARDGKYELLEAEVNKRISESEEAGEEFPHERRYLHLLAVGLLKSGDHAGAADVYRKIIARYPRDVSAYALLSDALVVLENFDQAISALSTGLEIDPKNIPMHERLLKVYRNLGDKDNARRQNQIIQDLKQ